MTHTVKDWKDYPDLSTPADQGGLEDLETRLSDYSDQVQANTQTANYTLVATDRGKCVEMDVGTSNTLTVPPNSSVAFPVGTVLEVLQKGIGQTVITPGSGVTFLTVAGATRLISQYSSASLRKRATDEWVLSGDLTTSVALADSFNRANENPLASGFGWSTAELITASSTNRLQVVSNAVKGVTASAYNSQYQTATLDPDVEVSATLATAPNPSNVNEEVNLYARVTSPGTASYNGYAAYVYRASSTTQEMGVHRIAAGVVTTVVSQTVTTLFVNGDGMKLRCLGSQVSLWRRAGASGAWTQVVSGTDTTYPAGGVSGLMVYSNVIVLDDFVAAPF